MGKHKRTSGAPSMSKEETASVYAELEQSHSHCLLLIATCTELGKDIRDSEMLKFVADLPALVNAAETVAERLTTLKSELDVVRSHDLAMRAKRVGADNIMRVLAVGQEYEAWMGRFGRSVSPSMDKAYALIEAARKQQQANAGSNA